MKGFGVHTSMWTSGWTKVGAEFTLEAVQKYNLDFIEISIADTRSVDAAHTRKLLEAYKMHAVCSLGLPEYAWPSRNPDQAVEFLKLAIDLTADIGAEALSGVTFGGIGERTGVPPTQAENDNVARAMTEAGKYARSRGISLGIEAVNRYENHLINTAAQAVALIERIGLENVFVHLDTYHMNIEEKGMGNGIITARDHLRYIHLSESDRGTPGEGNCHWDETFATLAAIGFKGGLAMESFINMEPLLAYGLSVWRPVAESEAVVMGNGLPFLRNKARQYGLI
ncbi:MAG: sugar phosphate isomerase/epimerase family protein [bacterium]